jgi:hypothetical protein
MEQEREPREAVLLPGVRGPLLYDNEFQIERRGHAEARARLDRISKGE